MLKRLLFKIVKNLPLPHKLKEKVFMYSYDLSETEFNVMLDKRTIIK